MELVTRAKEPMSVCTCGHTGDGPDSMHENTMQAGHGHCKDERCECKQFTWKRFTAYGRGICDGLKRKR